MMYVNIIHRPSFMDGFKFQQDIAHDLGFKTTILFTLQSLFEEETIQYCLNERDKYGDELGICMSTMECKEIEELTGSREMMLHLFSFETQKKVIDFVFNRFKTVTGDYPKSISTYYIGAKTLQWMKEQYPSLEIAITNCFEEGVNMYHGNCNAWNLFCEGGPWGAYYPSKVNSLVPAKDEESAIGVVGVPHLNRDMLMAYIGRDDCYSSHSANVQRGMVNDGNKCQYLYDFIHQWVKQGDYNKDVYYNMFVGPNWLMEGKNFEESQEDSRDLYKQTLEECKRLEDEGKACICTMDEYAGYHKANHSPGECEVNHWKDLLYNSKREIVWYVSPQYRLAIDVCLGGTFVDLRPYAGEYEVETGINESNIWNGGYPFALSFPHRWSFHTATVNGVDLGTVRTRAKIENLENGEKRIILEPVGITVDGDDVTVATIFDMKKDGIIKMIRKIISAPDKNKEYSISEDFKGCVGLNEYPVDFSGTVLKVTDKDGKIETLVAGYQDRKIGGCAIKGECDVEVLNTRFVFTPEGDSVEIYAEEGYMFAPYYTMRTIHNKIKEGEEAVTWLKIEKK